MKKQDFQKQRSVALTETRQRNNVMEEQVRAMELAMRLPKLRKEFVKFMVRDEWKKHYIKSTPALFRWVRWIEFYLTSKSKRRRLLREITNSQDQQQTENQ